MFNRPVHILILGLLTSLSVYAAKPSISGDKGESKTSKASEIQKQRTQEILKNISIVGFYNMADKLSFEGGQGNVTATGEFNTTSSYGVGFETRLKTLSNGINLKAGASYEFGRTFSKQISRVGNDKFTTSYVSPKPEYSAWVLAINGELPLTDEVSVFGGGNYNFPTIKNAPGTYTGKVGWQVGASFLLSENFYVDGMWRSLNNTGSVDDFSFDNINTAGLVIRGRVTFE